MLPTTTPKTPTERTSLTRPNVEVGFFSRSSANVKRLCKEYNVKTKLIILAALAGVATIFYFFSTIESECERFTRTHSNATKAEIADHCPQQTSI